MGAYAWLSESEMKRMSEATDRDLNELFQEVRVLIPDTYFIAEREIWHKRNWWRDSVRTFSMSYTLYIVSKSPEVMVFNFPSIDGKMNFGCDRPTLMTYFYGVLNGISHIKNNK